MQVNARGLIPLSIGLGSTGKLQWHGRRVLHLSCERLNLRDTNRFYRIISSGASVVAIDNKIEQAMDLVKSHLMYAVREEVEVLKEQIKELIEKNSQLEQENTLLKTLASPEQLAQFQAQLQTGSPPSSQTQGTTQQPAQPASQGSGPSA
ncbi:TSC22 domain family protein 1 isoform X2 [Caretta caretta]|uniref:TSC22 domain family protein 1 isoform X2 n=1 Tax=Caretta caretta TaxID=8467 RepID=UPI002095985D|nr:TSC22 domain family protein 1 isoform X2 [Caretta caretta]